MNLLDAFRLIPIKIVISEEAFYLSKQMNVESEVFL
jgi:hypothetical protein